MCTASDVVITVTGTLIRESEKAVLFKVEYISGEPVDDPVSHWFPLSQIKKMTHDKNVKGNDVLVITEWIAKMKELI